MWLAQEVWEGGPWTGLALEAWPVAAIGGCSLGPRSAEQAPRSPSPAGAEVQYDSESGWFPLSPIPTADVRATPEDVPQLLHGKPSPVCHIGRPGESTGPPVAC